MREIKLFAAALGILLTFGLLHADPVIHKFELWGKSSQLDKMNIYIGWTNGFLAARGPRGMEFAKCLDQMSMEQATAMIDKRYNDHPELWLHPLGEQILDAVTAGGGPCEGKNPLDPAP
jgi:hypothetical protein